MAERVTTLPLANCISEISKATGPAIDGITYPTSPFIVIGTRSNGVRFRAYLGLAGGRGSNPGTPYPEGYQWGMAVNLP